jgi:hypothetical protein
VRKLLMLLTLLLQQKAQRKMLQHQVMLLVK